MSTNDYFPGRQHAKDDALAGNNRVFLGGLNPAWGEDDVAKMMGKFGKIEAISVVRSYTGESKCYAFVTFATSQAAASSYGLLQYQNRMVESKPSLKQGPSLRKKYEAGAIGFKSSKHVVGAAINSSAHRPIAKLSKHSETFETGPDLDQSQPTVRVKVIELTEDQSPLSQSAYDFSGSLPSSPKSKLRSDDRATTMSRLSKEFHPLGSNLPYEYYPSFAHPAAYSTIPANPFQAFPVFNYPAPYAKVGEGSQAGVEQPPFRSARGESHVRINFYTFPGRD